MFDSSHFHPMLVHFPIALVTVGFLFDVYGMFFKKEKCLSLTGMYLLFIGTFSAIAAVLAGFLFTNEMEGAAGQLRERHELFAIISICILLLTSIIRIFMVWKKKENRLFRWIVLGLYLCAVGSISFTGFMGGSLVYNFLIGI